VTAAAIRADLAAAADPERAAGMARYFQARPGGYGEGDRFLGIAVPEQRRIARRHAAGTSLEDADELLTSPLHEERLTALFVLVQRFQRADEGERQRLLDRDQDVLDELAASPSVWDRRIAVMATFAAVRADRFKPTLRLADRLLEDPHDLVQKAVGWMLREVGDRDRALAEEFLGPRYRRMPRTMLRYAIEKYPPDRRRAYLTGAV
jgi:hypothetical protein